MTTGELARRLLAYGGDRPVTVRAVPRLGRGELEVSADSPTMMQEDVEVLLEVGTVPEDLVETGVPF